MVGSVALFPIEHKHEPEQNCAYRPHTRNDAVPEEFSIRYELEQSDRKSDEQEPHMFALDPTHRLSHHVVVGGGNVRRNSHCHLRMVHPHGAMVRWRGVRDIGGRSLRRMMMIGCAVRIIHR